jgi:hypothetical protein
MDTKIEIEQVQNQATELVTPALPVDFTSAILIDAGTECLWDWLKNNAPQEYQNIFNAICWAWEMKCQAAKNDGKVSFAQDDPQHEWFFLAVKSMSDTGFNFSYA